MLPSVEVWPIVVRLLLTLGIPLLLVLFFFEGMIVGKVARPAAVFILYTLLARPFPLELIVLAGLCALATTMGQWVLYRRFSGGDPLVPGLRRRYPFLDRAVSGAHRWMRGRSYETGNQLFDRFGGAAVFVSGVIPGVRTLISIPAGVHRYPVKRFLGYALLGNVVYMGVLVLIARGILRVSAWVPWP